MNIKVKDKVIDTTSGSLGVVISTHTYNEGTQVASVKLDNNGSKWVAVTELKKVS